MQRPPAPKNQVAIVEEYLKGKGVQPKRSESLELVAHLNGAPNWNGLTRRTEVPEAAPAVTPTADDFVRIVPKKHVPLVVRTTMFDEETGFFLLMPSEDGTVYEEVGEFDGELFDQLVEQGTVIEAAIEYPNANKFGLPEYATRSGFATWLALEQGMFRTADCALHTEDLNDDSMASCDLRVMVPPELLRTVYNAFGIKL